MLRWSRPSPQTARTPNESPADVDFCPWKRKSLRRSQARGHEATKARNDPFRLSKAPLQSHRCPPAVQIRPSPNPRLNWTRLCGKSEARLISTVVCAILSRPNAKSCQTTPLVSLQTDETEWPHRGARRWFLCPGGVQRAYRSGEVATSRACRSKGKD